MIFYSNIIIFDKIYYGDGYQLNRIIQEQSVLYLATADNILVGVSYIIVDKEI